MSRFESGTYVLVPLPPSAKMTFYLLSLLAWSSSAPLPGGCCPVRPQFCSVLRRCTSAVEEPLLIAVPTLSSDCWQFFLTSCLRRQSSFPVVSVGESSLGRLNFAFFPSVLFLLMPITADHRGGIHPESLHILINSLIQ